MAPLRRHALSLALSIGLGFLGFSAPPAAADDACLPFGGTIYGWHDTATDSWYGVGEFTVGQWLT